MHIKNDYNHTGLKEKKNVNRPPIKMLNWGHISSRAEKDIAAHLRAGRPGLPHAPQLAFALGHQTRHNVGVALQQAVLLGAHLGRHLAAQLGELRACGGWGMGNIQMKDYSQKKWRKNIDR